MSVCPLGDGDTGVSQAGKANGPRNDYKHVAGKLTFAWASKMLIPSPIMMLMLYF